MSSDDPWRRRGFGEARPFWEESRPVHGDTARRPHVGDELRTLVLPAVESTPAAKSTSPTVAEPSPLVVALSTTDGCSLANVELIVRRYGFEQRVTTNAEGAFEITVPDVGIYEVEFAQVPVVLPPVPVEPPSGPGPIYSRKLPRDTPRFEASTGGRREVLVVRPAVVEVLVDGWSQGARVMRWGGMRPRLDGTVATARGALSRALWLGRGRTMCIAGHADPLGQDADNDALATDRATSVALFAQGMLDDWAAHAVSCATELDFDCALVAVHRILGMGPVELDDVEGLDAAHKALRLQAGLADDAPVGADDWKAIAELYEVDLATLLFTDRAGLAEIRSAITWTEPAFVSLGERHPRPFPELGDLVSSTALAHRRTALCIFGSPDTPQAAVDGGGDELYDGTYARMVVPIPGEVLVDIAVDTPSRDAIVRGRAWIACAGLGVHEHTAGLDGHIRFMTLKGDGIEVVAAFDSRGRGTMVAAGTEES